MSQYTTIGIDLGDITNTFCVLDNQGEEMKTGTIDNTAQAISQLVASYPKAVVAVEASTHSPWISSLLMEQGYTVYVGNSRKLRAIWGADDKTDKRDARMLAQIARFDPKLLYPIQHRKLSSQRHLQMIRSRDALVKTRTQLISHVRSSVKVFGGRITSGISTPAFATKARGDIPEELESAMLPMLDTIKKITQLIREYDKKIEDILTNLYPETGRLRQVKGVGPITALAFVLTLENPSRFKHSRDVGPMLGLVPRRDQSGNSDPQLSITKRGDSHLRCLLVGAAHYILGPFGEDCDLRRHGMKIAARGGKRAKKRAIVAVARKLAVLLHRLWRSGDKYNPNYNQSGSKKRKAATSCTTVDASRERLEALHQAKSTAVQGSASGPPTKAGGVTQHRPSPPPPPGLGREAMVAPAEAG